MRWPAIVLLLVVACSGTRTTPPSPPDDGSGADVEIAVDDLAPPIEDVPADDVAPVEDPGADVAPTEDVPPPQDVADTPPPPPEKATIVGFETLLSAEDETAFAAFAAGYDMPLCEANTCLFLSKVDGAASVSVSGEHDAWGAGTSMAPVAFAGGYWWAKVAIAFEVVTEYKLRPDGGWSLDPSNRWFRFGGFGANSAIYRPGHGRLTMLQGVASTELGNTRDLFVYLPAAYFEDADAHFPVLYMQDGFNVFSNPKAPFGDWHVDVTADALNAASLAQPVIIVGIDTANRIDEYLYAAIDIGGAPVVPKLDLYAAFVEGTVKPLVDATFRTLPGRETTAIAGSSLGGISALWMAWTGWKTFGLVASMSGSFWVGEGEDGLDAMRDLILANAEKVPKGGVRVYLDAGNSDFDGTAAYAADSWAESDWTRNALIAAGWQNRVEWDTDDDLATPPKDLSSGTAASVVPHMPWAETPPAGYAGWADWLGTDRDLVMLVGHGHSHNEAAWAARFSAAMIFLFPGSAVLP